MLPKPKSIFENWHPFVRTGAATTRSKLEEKQRNFIAKWGPLVRNKMEIPIMLHVDLVHWRTTAANQRRAYDRGEESGRKFVSSMLGWETIIDDPRTAEIARYGRGGTTRSSSPKRARTARFVTFSVVT